MGHFFYVRYQKINYSHVKLSLSCDLQITRDTHVNLTICYSQSLTDEQKNELLQLDSSIIDGDMHGFPLNVWCVENVPTCYLDKIARFSWIDQIHRTLPSVRIA